MPALMSETFSVLIRSPWIHGPLAFVLWVVGFAITRKILFAAMRRVARRANWPWDAVLVKALSAPLGITILASGLLVLERILPLSKKWDRALDVSLAAAVALAIVLFIDRASSGLLDRLAKHSADLQGARGLIQGTVRGLAAGLGLLIFLDSIGISITPILASLGVGSLAVALALQETLANLFAGLYMVADKPIEAGHFIRLGSGEEGFVSRIGWRSTWIRTGNDSVIIVPNSKLAGSVITNFDLPERELAFGVELAVRYDGDLDRVERVTLEVAREVQATVAGGVPAAAPAVHFHSFGESGARFTVTLRARDFNAVAALKHELVKRIVARYHRDGIAIPFPTRTLDLPPGGLPSAAPRP